MQISRDSIKTLYDLQKLLGDINWIQPKLGISTYPLSHLFSLLRGNQELNSSWHNSWGLGRTSNYRMSSIKLPYRQNRPFWVRRQRHPTPVLLLGKSQGRRSLVGCSPRGHEESDMTERLHYNSKRKTACSTTYWTWSLPYLHYTNLQRIKTVSSKFTILATTFSWLYWTNQQALSWFIYLAAFKTNKMDFA